MGYLPDYNEHGLLPVGRWQASTPDDIASKYIPSGDVCREDLWSAWVDTTGILRAAFGEVIACWLSGSFFSTKPDPRDIDCLYIISHDTFANPVDSELAATVRKMRTNRATPLISRSLSFTPTMETPPPRMRRSTPSTGVFGTIFGQNTEIKRYCYIARHSRISSRHTRHEATWR